MAISLVGTPTAAQSAGSVSTVTCAVPTGVVAGDLLVFSAIYNNNSSATTPTGWTIVNTNSTVGCGLSIYWRVAGSSEPPSYDMTITSSRAAGIMAAYRGVDNTTPMDVTATSLTANGSQTFPAVTPVTSGAWVIAIGGHTTGTGETSVTWSSTNATVDAFAGSQVAGTTDETLAYAHFAWTSGAFTTNLTSSNTTGRSVSTAGALRPSGPTNWTQTPTDDPGLTDSIAITQKHVLTDSAGLTDSATVAKQKFVAPSDTTGLTDSVVVAPHHFVLPTDPAGLTDTQKYTQKHAYSDTTGLTDTPKYTQKHAYSDTSGLTDSALIVKQKFVAPSDTTGLTDSATVVSHHFVSQIDPAGLTDSANVVKTPGGGSSTFVYSCRVKVG